jgi:hypothetical protein
MLGGNFALVKYSSKENNEAECVLNWNKESKLDNPVIGVVAFGLESILHDLKSNVQNLHFANELSRNP